MTRIVGIVLVKNEDLFVEQAVRNILEFCDEILLCDHASRDGTADILRRLAGERPDKLQLHPVSHPSESHDLIAPLAGQKVWVFGVDGDELYDPERLRRFRPRLVGGEFDDWWLIRSNALHATELDARRRWAAGYTAPPASSMVKLHNFALIERWDGVHPERLHGTEGLVFKPGREGRKLELGETASWADTPLRCLHLCFVRRSSLERRAQARINIPDLNVPRRLPNRLAWRATRAVRAVLHLPEQSPWKQHYRRGRVVRVLAEPFFPARDA